MDLRYFIFGETRSNIYKTYISGDGVYNFPEEEYEKIVIPGRSGDLAIRGKRYENIKITYPATIFADSEDDFDINLTELINSMKAQHGYQRLETTYRPEEYRMAMFYDAVDVTPDEGGESGEFDIVFDCKPQRFLKVGEIPITLTAAGNINNPTLYEAKPLIKVTGYGRLGIGDDTIAITGSAGQVIYIDCDMMEAYSISGSSIVSKNSAITMTSNDFPTLQAGTTGISLASTITEVEITPRWWQI